MLAIGYREMIFCRFVEFPPILNVLKINRTRGNTLSLFLCERVILQAGTTAPLASLCPCVRDGGSGCNFHVVINLIGGISISQVCINHTLTHHIFDDLSLSL